MRIFEWHWCPLPKHIQVEHRKIVCTTLKKLMERGASAHGLKLERLHGFPKSIGPIFSIRYSHEGRIILSNRSLQGKTYWCVLGVLANHEYDAFFRRLRSVVAQNPSAWEQFFGQAEPTAHATEGLETAIAAETSDSEENSSIPLPTGDPNEPWSFEGVFYADNRWIIADEDQGRVIQQQVQLPLVLKGFAGSGKTLAALLLLKQVLTRENARVLYVARSSRLVDKVRRDFESRETLEDSSAAAAAAEAAAPRSSIEFLTYNQLLNQVLGEKGLRFSEDEQAGKKAFHEWMEQTLQRNNLPRRAMELLRNEADKLYLEFRIIAGFRDKYLEIGNKGALFSKDEAGDRELLLRLFRDFEQYLGNRSEKVPEFYDDKEVQPLFTTIVFDEAGGETTASLLFAARLAFNQQILYCVDHRQVFESKISDMHLMQVLLERPVQYHHLRRVYRCTAEMAAVAAKVDELRSLFAPGAKAAGDFMVPSAGERVGGVQLVQLEDESALTRIQSLSNDAHFCVVTYDEYLAEARERFPHTAVLPVSQVRGLEFRIVVLYKPFGPRIFADINRQIERAEHSITDKHLEFTEWLSLLFIGMTRPEQFLFLCDDFKQRRIKHLMDFLAPVMKMGKGAEVRAEESSDQEWEMRAREYLQQGHHELASDILKNRLKRTSAEIQRFIAYNQGAAGAIAVTDTPAAGAKDIPEEKPNTTGKTRESKKKAKGDPQEKAAAQKKTVSPVAAAGISKAVPSKPKSTDDTGFENFLFGLDNNSLDPGKIRTLLQKNPDWTTRKGEGQLNILSIGILSNKPFSVIEALIETGVSIHDRNKMNATPLHHACQVGRLDVVKKLLDLGVEVDAEDDNGYTPLFYASSKGELDVVAALLRKGADFTKKNKKGVTALHVASLQGHLSTVSALLAAGAPVNEQDNVGNTPLIHAASTGNLSIVKVLLDYGANVSIKNVEDCIALHAAVEKKNIAVVNELIAANACVDARATNGTTPLMIAAGKDDHLMVKRLLDKGAKVDAVDNDGNTALIIASSYGSLDAALELLAAGANAKHVINKKQASALHFAATEGHADIVVELIRNHADVHARDSNGKTALHYYAVSEKNVLIAEALLNAGARVDDMDIDGRTPLHIARKIKTIRILLKKSDPHFSQHVKILLERACQERFALLLAYLITTEHPFNPLEKVDGTSLTPFLLACMNINDADKNKCLDETLQFMLSRLSTYQTPIPDEDAMAGLRLVCITNNINRAIVFLNHRPQIFSALYREKPELVQNIYAQLSSDNKKVLSDQIPNLKGSERAAVGGKPFLPSGGPPKGPGKEESAAATGKKAVTPDTRKRAVA